MRVALQLLPDTPDEPLPPSVTLDGAEAEALLILAQRLVEGRRRYGRLCLAEDPRCWPKEALEEAIDGLAYAAFALLSARPW